MRSTDDASAAFVSSTASDRKGFVKGEAVPLDRVLPTFARTKVGPRRAGVQILISKRLCDAEGDYKLGLKFLLLLFWGEKQGPAAR